MGHCDTRWLNHMTMRTLLKKLRSRHLKSERRSAMSAGANCNATSVCRIWARTQGNPRWNAMPTVTYLSRSRLASELAVVAATPCSIRGCSTRVRACPLASELKTRTTLTTRTCSVAMSQVTFIGRRRPSMKKRTCRPCLMLPLRPVASSNRIVGSEVLRRRLKCAQADDQNLFSLNLDPWTRCWTGLLPMTGSCSRRRQLHPNRIPSAWTSS